MRILVQPIQCARCGGFAFRCGCESFGDVDLSYTRPVRAVRIPVATGGYEQFRTVKHIGRKRHRDAVRGKPARKYVRRAES